MNPLFWLVIVLFSIFRWPILRPFLGLRRMYLFDAIWSTIWAAYVLAGETPWQVLNYVLAGFLLVGTYTSVQRWQVLGELEKQGVNLDV